MQNQRTSGALIVLVMLVLLINIFVLFGSNAKTLLAESGDFTHYEVSVSLGGFGFFDTKSGEIWTYSTDQRRWYYFGKLVKPGSSLVER
jgi:hypothetical protein